MNFIVRDAAERALCARLARILQNHFAKHDVDSDYNRQDAGVKEVELPDADGVLTSSNVSPDIIVHQVGHDDENILVIEVKKSTNAQSDERDLIKLEKLKKKFGYRFAVFLRLPTGLKADVNNIQMTWVK